MGTCRVMGQADGKAAALCVRHGISPRELYQQKPRLRELQQQLVADDQTINGIRSQSPNYVSLRAQITSSS